MKAQILLATSLVLVLTLFGAGLVQTRASQPLSIPQASQPDSLVFTLKVPAPQTNPDGKNNAPPSLEGYEASGAPGDPLLPVKAFNIALPPDVIPESVKAQVIQVQNVDLDGTYTLHLRHPARPGWMTRQVILWGKNAASILDGKNTQVYQNDAYFPQSQLSEVRFDQMRKWRFVNLLLTPLQYNPVTGKLRLASEVQVQVTFERAASVDQRQLQIELSDTVMDERAAELLYNYDQAQAWYPVMAKPDGLSTTYNYVIITTKYDCHRQHKSSTALSPTSKPRATACWSSPRTNMAVDRAMAQPHGAKNPPVADQQLPGAGIEYVLLIGDPTPYDPA